ncbi:translation elongation factor Ts [Gloeobacter violaceus]|uniref:Elongation factor Ts n=1 Tax=Gloeobacter violaceus (strain ATCC 29082 / PCC 7421) TaxID=251221 RepID=EFTS_GLOVI|nr:translation elongation factor Ts [Gloeobacter violaceus]Q7NJK3.1 RecName: Full=Elongation factor Ts; Short=EF-Ts [Gloeobacter violaceus PCC 7421]BAC89770.1 elongation factor TS [Gloeobacter violaceus PCC 7421]
MAEITSQMVMQLREKTQVGVLDCKKALAEAEGDLEKAIELLRKKGIMKAGKVKDKVATEGLVGSYIHTGGRIGVLVEVNCQTDFVAKGEEFQQLVRDIAMQIAASPNVEFVSVDDVDQEVKDRELAIEVQREDLLSKPEKIRAQIAQGRVDKLFKERALLEQPFIKDQSISVGELITQKIAKIGENIKVRRFARFVLGEGLEKEEKNFAEEVAAQTGSV